MRKGINFSLRSLEMIAAINGGIARGKTSATERSRFPGKSKFSTNQAAGMPSKEATTQEPITRMIVSLIASLRRKLLICCQASVESGDKLLNNDKSITKTGANKVSPSAQAKNFHNRSPHVSE